MAIKTCRVCHDPVVLRQERFREKGDWGMRWVTLEASLDDPSQLAEFDNGEFVNVGKTVNRFHKTKKPTLMSHVCHGPFSFEIRERGRVSGTSIPSVKDWG